MITTEFRRPVRCLVVALAATTLAAGCSSSTSSQPTAAGSSAAGSTSASTNTTAAAAGKTIDLCTLLTAKQVSGLNRVTYDTTSTVTNGDFHGCEYHNTGADSADITDLNITLTSSSGCWAAAMSSDGPGTAVSGVGDAAFGFSLGLHVEHGTSCLTIEGETLAESKGDWGADTVMAQTLLQRLG